MPTLEPVRYHVESGSSVPKRQVQFVSFSSEHECPGSQVYDPESGSLIPRRKWIKSAWATVAPVCPPAKVVTPEHGSSASRRTLIAAQPDESSFFAGFTNRRSIAPRVNDNDHDADNYKSHVLANRASLKNDADYDYHDDTTPFQTIALTIADRSHAE